MPRSSSNASATPLQAQLDEITAQTRTLVQPERLAVAEAGVAELFASGIEDRILAPGTRAPSFSLPDALTSKTVRSEDLLALGPLILVFFRGRWCPYCMTTLEAWQASYAEVRRRGALLVAISPQLPRQNDFTVQQHALTYPVLSDAGCSVASSFGLTHTVPEPLQQHYRSILVNIPFVNGDSTWSLPLAATFILNQGIVTYSEAHADHRVRPDPADVLALL